MASLNFKGKTAVWNHHLSVPYCTLEKVQENSLAGENEADNLLIEGDNLIALKALLPKYRGKVKCVYIDPPYNTGFEGWVYSDSVSNPIISEWLGEVVGKDVLTRHDRWLCMMTPRLKLLKELLSDDGIIFVSIDSNEVHNLKCLMNEIFHEDNYIGDFQWKKKSTSTNVEGAQVSKLTDYTLCYSKTDRGVIKPRIKYAETRVYPHKDELGEYRLTIIEKKNAGAYRRDTMTFKILGQNPRLGKRWQIGEDTARDLEKKNRLIIDEGVVKRKIYSFEDKDTTSAQPLLLLLEDVGTTDSAGDSLEELFDIEEMFDNAKPPELIKHLISVVCESDDIILDSFAGSGTTGQAVMELNQEDGGNRKFILVQLPETLTEKAQAKSAGYDYVHEITLDRIRKFKEKEKLNIGMTYYRLGNSIESKKIITGDYLPSWENFAKYIYFLATGKPLDSVESSDETWEIKSSGKSTGVFLIYKDTIEKLKNLAITRDWLELVKAKEGKKIVYAPACFLDKEVLDDNNISFVQIPYNLFERK